MSQKNPAESRATSAKVIAYPTHRERGRILRSLETPSAFSQVADRAFARLTVENQVTVLEFIGRISTPRIDVVTLLATLPQRTAYEKETAASKRQRNPSLADEQRKILNHAGALLKALHAEHHQS